jgi:cation transport regulator
MPFRSNSELPETVRRHLPRPAQDVYRAAYNHAYAARLGDPQRVKSARRVAWKAVKHSFVKVGAHWIDRALIAPATVSIH